MGSRSPHQRVSSIAVNLFKHGPVCISPSENHCRVGDKNAETYALMKEVVTVCETKSLAEGFLAVDSLRHYGLSITREMAYYLLQHCTNQKDLSASRRVYLLMVDGGLDALSNLGDHLIRLFASCGCLYDATKVFGNIINPTVHSWHAIISAHSIVGEKRATLNLYYKMRQEEIVPNIFIFSCVLKACTTLRDLQQGQSLHGETIKGGLESDVFVGSSLIDMYCKCNSLEAACKIFHKLPQRNMVTWNTMIAGFVQHGKAPQAFELFKKSQDEGLKPDKATFLCTMKACGNVGCVTQAKLIHEEIIKCGFALDVVIGNTLVDMYGKCGVLEKAQQVFDSLETRDGVSWSAIISGYVQHGHAILALQLFEKMQEAGIKPEKVTLLCMLKACGLIGMVEWGKMVHDQLVRNGQCSDVAFANTLIDMYTKCGCLQEAHELFEALPLRTVVTFNAMLTGYAHHGCAFHVFDYFDLMQLEGIKPNNITFSGIFKACGILGALRLSELAHDHMLKEHSNLELFVENSLIDMYVKCGNLEAAHKVFNGLSNPDLVSFGALISGYAEHGPFLPALELYGKLREEGLWPDKIIFLSILKSCGCMGALKWGKLLHDHVTRTNLVLDVTVANAIIDMYAKCGSLLEATQMFARLSTKSVLSWNALIGGYAQHGQWLSAINCFADMQTRDMCPEGRTFTCILGACSHSGQVDEGYKYFKSMKNYGLTPSAEQFNCMIYLLSHAGRLCDAEKLLNTMPTLPNITTWISLLTSCSSFGNVDLGRRCFEQVMRWDPNSSGAYALMLNMYKEAQMWDDAHKLEERRNSTTAWKKPGNSWLEVDDKLHEFIVGDQTHYRSDDIQSKLEGFLTSIKRDGHVPCLDFIVQPACEKLANLDVEMECTWESYCDLKALLCE